MAYDDIINAAGQQYGIDPDLLRAQMMQESGGNPNAVSKRGAMGLMQLMPGTAADMGVSNIKDPNQNIMGGAKYMRQLIDKYGDIDKAVQAYNVGPGAFDEIQSGKRKLPQETSEYLDRVSTNFGNLKKGITQQPATNPTADLDEWLGRSKAQDKGGASTLDEWLGRGQKAPPPITSNGGPGAAMAQTQQSSPQSGSMLDELGRQVGLTARAGITGLSALPNMVGDAANSLINMGVRGVNNLAGTNIPQLQMPSQVTQQAMNAVGLPQPQNATERVVQDVAGAMSGAGGQVALGRALSGSAAPIIQNIGNQLSQAAGTQIIGAGSSAGASGAARENGVGIGGQLAAGLLGAAAPMVAGRVLAPQTRPEVVTLMNEGITPTPGQIAGGFIQRTEDKARSIPVLGDMITSAQRRGVEDLNRAAYARALQGVPNAEVPKTLGREAVDDIAKQLGNAYDDVLGKMKFQADQQFLADMSNVASNVQSLPPKQVSAYRNFLDEKILSQMSSGGAMSGETLKRVEGAISREAKQFSGSPDPFNQKLGEQLQDTLTAFRDSLLRNNPDQAPQLQQLNASYANYARLRDAASRIGSEGGVFTPAQLNSAVRAADKSVAKGGFARGNALMQDLSGAGVNVLGPKYPDSGTAGRMAFAAGSSGALGAINPGALLGLGGASLAYTPPVQKAIAAALVKRPELIRQLGQQTQGYNPAMIGALLSSQALNANQQAPNR